MYFIVLAVEPRGSRTELFFYMCAGDAVFVKCLGVSSTNLLIDVPHEVADFFFDILSNFLSTVSHLDM